MTIRTANCPGCGAGLEFDIGSSLVLVCQYCNSLVARTDRDVESLGKVAALIDSSAVLRRGLWGAYGGKRFQLVGRTQLRHDSGAVWDEWYAAFDDGRWGWLAESEGRYYLTFEREALGSIPEIGALQVGTDVEGMAGMRVVETGHADLVSAEGELPWRPVPGGGWRYADLSGPNQSFATIDDSDGAPSVFLGREVTLAALGIDATQIQTRKVAATKLSCSQCGAPLDLVAPDRTERVICPSCGGIHDVVEGKLRLMKALGKKQRGVEPVIPIGTKGRFGDEELVVAGFMQRAVTFSDGTSYWTEYLLFNRAIGYRYLEHDQNHWSLSTPIAGGDIVETSAKHVSYGGRRYSLFEEAPARVTTVLGEFPWLVEIGETVQASDYIAPPEGVAKEIAKTERGSEINYSHTRYLETREVEKAFGVENLPKPSGVHALQPNPHVNLTLLWGAMLLAVLGVAMFLGATLPNREVVSETWDLTTLPPASRTVSTKPFTLTGRRNLVVSVHGGVAENQHLQIDGEVVNEETGLTQPFELWSEYATGVDDEGRWTEDERRDRVFLTALPPGEYTIDVQAQWSGDKAPTLDLSVREGVFRWSHLILALIAVSLIPAIQFLRYYGFEKRRWAESDFSPFAALQSDDDDDDDDDDEE